MGGPIIYSHDTNLARGVCILINLKQKVEIISEELDIVGRYIIAELNVMELSVLITNVYAPNEDCPNFFTELFPKINNSNSTDRVIAGDFNLVLYVEIDRYQSKHNNTKAANVINTMLEGDYSDQWRVNNPEKRQYLWFRSRCRILCRQCARLDYCITSDQLST